MVEISELLGSRIIRVCAHKSVCTAPHTHTHVYIGVKEMAAAAICIESDDDVVEPEVKSEYTQSSIESFFAPLPAGQVPSPRPRSEVRLCIHESLEQHFLTRTRYPTT